MLHFLERSYTLSKYPSGKSASNKHFSVVTSMILPPLKAMIQPLFLSKCNSFAFGNTPLTGLPDAKTTLTPFSIAF